MWREATRWWWCYKSLQLNIIHITIFWESVSPSRRLTSFDSIADRIICFQQVVVAFLLLSLSFMAPASYINDSLTLSVSISALSRSINISENLVFFGWWYRHLWMKKRKWKTTSVPKRLCASPKRPGRQLSPEPPSVTHSSHLPSRHVSHSHFACEITLSSHALPPYSPLSAALSLLALWIVFIIIHP